MGGIEDEYKKMLNRFDWVFICIVHDGMTYCLLTLYFYGHNYHCLVCPGPRPRQRCHSLKENHVTSSFHR